MDPPPGTPPPVNDEPGSIPPTECQAGADRVGEVAAPEGSRPAPRAITSSARAGTRRTGMN